MNPQLPPNLQPAYIRIINRVGQQLESAGFSGPHLNADRLVSQARKKTGLQNFGDDSFRVGLEKLTTELRDHARLSQIGRLAAHFNLLDHLCVRLRLIDYRLQRPEVAKQQIKQPLFIMGLPRTGTTILHELIAQDPAMRSPTSWEVARPFPPATPKSYESDRRIKSVDRMMGLAEMLSPPFMP